MNKYAFKEIWTNGTRCNDAWLRSDGNPRPRIWSGRPVTDGEAERILNAILDVGINFIDSAYDYGLSEAYIEAFQTAQVR
ncbi:aldo/keto reductase [Cohnella ginsengisoli]|uniref:Aldo/keto reductase n=1 Tax=Cohnella ginsengisoli TaxID=425004 RepID=A0A9X4KCV9_9BACL|nr:aldo/keto reductase [Cohnella ginsengisoli]MDG0789436.1 aldo/keto reductase [Cohnella ginsengisoli]